MNMVNHLKTCTYLFICHTQLTTYLNMTNHLFEHGKPLGHVLIYSDVILS